MRAYLTTLSIFLASTAVIVGCSNVGFQSIPKQTCSTGNFASGTNCSVQGNNLAYSFTFEVGDVDILFVDDNSGSMYSVQSRIANAFPNFFSSISNLFYNIAVVTTDISTSPGQSTPRAANGYGAFQDGKFLEFKDLIGNDSGVKVLTPSTPNKQAYFEGTIQRHETLACEQGGFTAANCPSNDERGIYAVNLALSRNENNFFRTATPLEVVIISNEDERSSGGLDGGLALESNDEPATLISNMTAAYPTKSISVHSIITDSQACLGQQTVTNPNGIETFGYIGYTYMSLSNPSASLKAIGAISPGTIGSVCSSNYGSQLSAIGSEVAAHAQNNPIQLACDPDPKTMTVSTSPAQYASQVRYSIDGQNKITFTNVPLGTHVTLAYQCPQY